MINWFDMPAEGLSNGGLFEVKELEVTENGTYETKGEMYNKVTVNVEGGGGSSDFSTANVTLKYPDAVDSRIAEFVGLVEYGEFHFISGTVPAPDTVNNTTAVLYQGKLHTNLDANIYNIESGSATVENGFIVITGDCTITLS